MLSSTYYTGKCNINVDKPLLQEWSVLPPACFFLLPLATFHPTFYLSESVGHGLILRRPRLLSVRLTCGHVAGADQLPSHQLHVEAPRHPARQPVAARPGQSGGTNCRARPARASNPGLAGQARTAGHAAAGAGPPLLGKPTQ